MNQIVAENKKLQSDIVMVKNVNRKLEGKIVYLEKKSGERGAIQPQKQRKNVRYTKQHSDEDLKNTKSICKDSGVGIDTKDIEGCHRLPISRNSRGQDK